jgi:hypothetical protein
MLILRSQKRLLTGQMDQRVKIQLRLAVLRAFFHELNFREFLYNLIWVIL